MLMNYFHAYNNNIFIYIALLHNFLVSQRFTSIIITPVIGYNFMPHIKCTISTPWGAFLVVPIIHMALANTFTK